MREFASANERRPDSGAVKWVRAATSDPHFALMLRIATRKSSRLLSWAPWPFLDPQKFTLPAEFEAQKNAHARFSKSSTCAPIFLGPKLAFWAIPPRVHKIMRCAKMRGSHTPSFFSKGISRRTLLDAQKSGYHSSNRKKKQEKNSVFCEFPIKVRHTTWAVF